MTWQPSLSKVLALIGLVLAVLALIGVGAHAPLELLAVVLVALAVAV